MIEWIKNLFTNEENINTIAVDVTTFIITTFVIGFIILFFKRIVNFLWAWIKKVFTKGKNRLKTMKLRRIYKRTIKQIERQEIPLPENFLLLKSPEKNPELKKIYQMIDEGLIEAPPSYKMQKFFKEHPELKDLKLDLSKLPDVTPKIKVKPLKFPSDFK